MKVLFTRVLMLSALLTACSQVQESKTPEANVTWAKSMSVGGTAATPSSSGRAVILRGDPKQAIENAYRAARGVNDGKNADYIPALAKTDPSLFGITLITAEGVVYDIGDANHAFSIQSISKIFTLARLIEEIGAEAVEQKIGANATGQPFNAVIAIELNEKKMPGNALVNAGAISAVSMLPARTPQERWSRIVGTMNGFAGHPLSVDPVVYKSETDTNAHNKGIAWLLKSYDMLPGDPDEALDLYTRQCSVSVTARDLAVMGATLANGGVNPLTKQRIVSPEASARTLSMMMTGGMYETSGTWSINVGVPAKSGVGGGLLAVVPGKYAIGTFSAPLDKVGNSVRGQKAIESIVAELGGNLFTPDGHGLPALGDERRSAR